MHIAAYFEDLRLLAAMPLAAKTARHAAHRRPCVRFPRPARWPNPTRFFQTANSASGGRKRARRAMSSEERAGPGIVQRPDRRKPHAHLPITREGSNEVRADAFPGKRTAGGLAPRPDPDSKTSARAPAARWDAGAMHKERRASCASRAASREGREGLADGAIMRRGLSLPAGTHRGASRPPLRRRT